jgi:hypothetical protein
VRKILLIMLLLVSPPLFADGAKFIETFSSSQVGGFPKWWRAKPSEQSQAEAVYRVLEEGGTKYLAADAEKGESTPIFKMASWDIEKWPIFTWRWRARKLPQGANESVPSRNDSACGIYVSFGMFKGKMLKYVWSSSLPAGTRYRKNDKVVFIVKRSGDGGGWVREETNLLEDAKEAFGEVPAREISGIGILTDGNATNSPSACDYDDIGYKGVE